MSHLSLPGSKLPSLCLFMIVGAFACVLAACDETLAITPPAEAPATNPPVVSSPTSIPNPALIDETCWLEWKQTRSVPAFDCARGAYVQAVKNYPDIPEYHFRLGVLNWEMGTSELEREQGREEIVNAILLDVLNGEYIEYLFAYVVPPPRPMDIGAGMEIYTDEFLGPYLLARSDGAYSLDMTEVHAPKNVAQGSAAIRLEWNKPGMTWASFIVGFDPDIADRQKALAGDLMSLGGLSAANLDEYAITFWAKGEELQGGLYEGEVDNTMNIKLQDQNIAIRDSIGNQMVYGIQITDRWKEYTIRLDDFNRESWIRDAVCAQQISYVDCMDSGLLYFDWSRVKQINFDVPFYSTRGVIYLDEIRIVRIN